MTATAAAIMAQPGAPGGRGYSLRAGTPDDYRFVFATWLRLYRKVGVFERPVASETYYAWMHRRVERLLGRGVLHVATLPADPSVILGYALTEDRTLHWVHVKGAWRRMGIGASLLPAGLLEYSHVTPDLDWLLKRSGMEFNPYRAE